MEGCPDDEGLNILYLILSGLLGIFVFLIVQAILKVRKGVTAFETKTKKESMMDQEFQELQVELYGEKALRRLLHENSSRSISTTATNKPVVTETPVSVNVSDPVDDSFDA